MLRHRFVRHLAVLGTAAGLFAAAPVHAALAPAKTPKAKPAAKKAAKGKAPKEAKKGVIKAAKSAKPPSVMGIEMPVQSFTLQNGLKVFVLEDHSTPFFAMHTAFRVGSRDEVAGRTGFAHLFEHMMFKGSKNVPDGGHFKHVMGVGGQMNAFTSADATQYFDIMPSHYLDRILWLESDRLRSLEVTDENFENQRDAVKEERAMRVENVPYSAALLNFFAEVWKGTGYGHMTIGSQADLDAAKTPDVQAFFNQYYVPNNAVMVLVGDVDFAEVKSKVEKYYADIPRGKDRAAFPAIDHAQSAPLEKVVEDPMAQQPLYMLGWKTVAETHPDRHAVELLMSILLRGDSSRITRILKDEKKMVVAAVPLPSFGGGRDAGMAMAAFIPVEGKGFSAIKEVVLAEIDTVKRRGISRKQLQKAKNQLVVDTVGRLATNNGRAFFIAQGALWDDDPTQILTDLEKYRAVTQGDIKRVANKYLTENWLVLQVKPKQGGAINPADLTTTKKKKKKKKAGDSKPADKK